MGLSDLVTPLARQTLSGDVYHQLRDLLLYGRAMPGEQLSLRNIAEALGVSVMPVREAVHRLVAEQALELSSYRALRVPILTVSQFQEITSIRINLEGLATQHAAMKLSDTALNVIDTLHRQFEHEISLSQPDTSRLIRFNKEMHFAIYDGAGMPMLMQMIESLWLRIGPILNYDLRSGSARVTSHEPADHHGALVQALRVRDGLAAAEALRRDIQGAADFIIAQKVLVIADGVSTDGPVVEKAKAVKRTKGARALKTIDSSNP